MSKRGEIRSITVPKGFLAAGGTCGIKASGKPDLALIVSESDCSAAGTFTRNKLPGAPLIVTRKRLPRGRGAGLRAIICNAGIANDATGDQGVANAQQTCEWIAQKLGCRAKQVAPASTGVIGPQLPMDKIERGVADLAGRLARGAQADADAARGIMTTDLVPKQALRRATIAGQRIAIGGIAKGSGMIAPNMATMLVFITTDLAVAPDPLHQALSQAVAHSFNRISVDQHTSPSDMALVLANGAAGATPITGDGDDLQTFADALTDLCQDLAYQIVKDGEGATRVFRVQVVGAKSAKDADRVGQAVVNSPLVKAAVHGGDPNWGRIVTAAGYSGAAMDPARLSLHIGARPKVCVFKQGQPTPITPAQQSKLEHIMTQKEVTFTLDLGLGDHDAQWLGCDLSYEYVRINAEYTT